MPVCTHSLIHSFRAGVAKLTFTQVLTLEKVPSFGVSHPWDGVAAPTLTISGTLGKLVNLSEPQFLHL